MTGIADEARQLLDQLEPHMPREVSGVVRAARARLDEPLRVAIAGRVKAGKSTMLNAVIGQAAAATDAAECTRSVTWYVDGTAYRAWARSRDGDRRQVPYRRTETDARIDLESTDLSAIERLEVEFPSAHLRTMTLIDTPGIASVSEQVSARAADFLIPDHGDQGADVVVYLLRHIHERDTDFLEAFTDPAIGPVGVLRSIAVLSRADEVGNGRGDSLQIARRIAERYASHPLLRAQVADVMPIAGLLAFAAATITEAEFAHLAQLAQLSQEELSRLLLSVDRLLSDSPQVPVALEARRGLIDRFGLFGIRLSTALIRGGACASAGELARTLEVQSGIQPLRRTLLERFASRAEVLKAARAVDLVAATIATLPTEPPGVRREVERIVAGSHELEELRCLAGLLGEADHTLGLEDSTRGAVLSALGHHGPEPWQRLSADAATPHDELIALALRRVEEFRLATLAPFVDRRTADILSVAVRSVEAVHFRLAQPDSGKRQS